MAPALAGVAAARTFPPSPVSFPAESACTSNSPGPTMLRRLSASQFAASIVDLFGDPSVPVGGGVQRPAGDGLQHRRELAGGAGAQRQPADEQRRGDRQLGGDQSPGRRHRLQRQRRRLSRVVHSLVRQAGVSRAAHRRDSVADYQALFSAEASFNDGVTAVISAMLQSPRFLYRTEVGDPTRRRRGGRDRRAHAVRGRVEPVVPADRQRARRDVAGGGRLRRGRQPVGRRHGRSAGPAAARRSAQPEHAHGLHDQLARPREALHHGQGRQRLHADAARCATRWRRRRAG